MIELNFQGLCIKNVQLITQNLGELCATVHLRICSYSQFYLRYHWPWRPGTLKQEMAWVSKHDAPISENSHLGKHRIALLRQNSDSKEMHRSRQGSNLRWETPLDFKSNALTTRPRLPGLSHKGQGHLVTSGKVIVYRNWSFKFRIKSLWAYIDHSGIGLCKSANLLC